MVRAWVVAGGVVEEMGDERRRRQWVDGLLAGAQQFGCIREKWCGFSLVFLLLLFLLLLFFLFRLLVFFSYLFIELSIICYLFNCRFSSNTAVRFRARRE